MLNWEELGEINRSRNKRVVTLDIHPVALTIMALFIYIFGFRFVPVIEGIARKLQLNFWLFVTVALLNWPSPFMRHHRAQVLGSSVNFSKSLNQRIQNRLWGLDGTLLLCGTESCGQWLATSNGGRFDFFDVGSWACHYHYVSLHMYPKYRPHSISPTIVPYLLKLYVYMYIQ